MPKCSCEISEFSCSVTAGGLFAVGWWWFVDGVLIAKHEGTHFGFEMTIPGILVTLGLICVNMLRPEDIRDDGMGDMSDVNKAKTFFFIAWMLIFGGLIAAIWICIADFGNASTTRTTTYPGVAIIMQTIVITLAAVIFWMGRGTRNSDVFG
eukprot:TRINITY_DN30428_c0_g1_i1.p1 TRINITY_DN30428_c0_g1~~TRINITY_DN30428_c0_g1_i1.p1  ORF type:complete len:152 (+),score=35.63 TRINITY_DN30428_c0_g1_i1:52-507(+)